MSVFLSLDEIKQIQLNMLIEFANFCKENNLQYYLCGGTLLGAVRHKGFIPWDNDIDVFMPRPDYERFKKQTAFMPIANNYYVCSYTPCIKQINYPYIKIIDVQTQVLEKEKNKNQKIGIWIDVFPIDGLSNDDTINRKLYKKNAQLRKLLGIGTANLSESKNIKKYFVKVLLLPFIRLYGLKRLCKKIDSQAMSYDYISAKVVGGLLWGYGLQEKLEKNDLVTIKVEFEQHLFNAPIGYKKYLTNLYGDYMQLPSKENQISHNIFAKKIITT